MKKIILGTAQLGMVYGIANNTGQLTRNEAVELVQCCLQEGVRYFDTARAYGESESILGQCLEGLRDTFVTSKFTVLEISEREAIIAMEASIMKSIELLKRNSVDSLLAHSWKSYKSFEGRTWSHVLDMKAKGLIGRVGVSVYNTIEAVDVLTDPTVGELQIPLNFLDKQWREQKFLDAVAKRPDVIVNVRSIYLQGLLLMDKWPNFTNIDSEWYVENINTLAKSMGFANKKMLCMAFAKSLDWIDGIIVGADNLAQVQENVGLFSVRRLSSSEMESIANAFPDTPSSLVDPRRWNEILS